MIRSFSLSNQAAMEMDDHFGAKNYHPLPVVLRRGQGVFLWDVEGQKYLDFLSAYSAVNQGHCHPKILQALVDQAHELTLTSRAFYSEALCQFVKTMAKTFGYDRILPMNSGAEAVETALKLARRWGYEKKGVPAEQAKIILCNDNFHGRTITIISGSTSSDSRHGFGPYTPGFITIPHGDARALAETLSDPTVVAFLVEPIQGEAGVIIPPSGYLKRCAELCRQSNVLLMADEIQTGLGRTGKMICSEHEGIKPDVLILGKALSGGFLPVSAVLASEEVMLVIKPGEHGSTFGGNPLACAVATAALKVIEDENLCENSLKMGQIFREELSDLVGRGGVSAVRGMGLMNAIEFSPDSPRSAWEICLALKDNGVLAKSTRETTLRFSPPLIIKEEELYSGIERIRRAIQAQ